MTSRAQIDRAQTEQKPSAAACQIPRKSRQGAKSGVEAVADEVKQK